MNRPKQPSSEDLEADAKFGSVPALSAYNNVVIGIDLLYEAAVSGNADALSTLRQLANQIFEAKPEALEMGPEP